MWAIIVRDPEGQEKSRTLLKRGMPVTVGRAADRTIHLGVRVVSRQHGHFELRHGTPVYFDEVSANGSSVDGQPVRGPTPLSEHSVLEIGGFRFTFERLAAEAARQAEPADDPPASTETASAATEILEAQLRGIRQFRQEMHEKKNNRVAAFGNEWKSAVEALRALRTRLQQEPRVEQFAVSRDEKEITVKITAPGETRGYRYFLLSREHPDGDYPGLEAVWLREIGRDDSRFQEPQKAMTELVQRIAGTLA